MTSFFVRPLETLFFGPPQSFSAGEAHRGDGSFPPSPQAFQGLVRSHLLHGAEPPLDLNDWSEAAKSERAALVGGPDDFPRGWQFTGPFPARNLTTSEGDRETELWFPTPRFLLRRTHDAPANDPPIRAEVVRSTHAALDDLAVAGSEFLPVGAPAQSANDPLGGWLSSRNLRWALARDVPWQVDHHHRASLPPFVQRERQAGVEREHDARTAKAGMLFLLEAVRFQRDSGLVGWLEANLDSPLNPESLQRGLAGAGRRRRPVAFERPVGPDLNWQQLQQGQHLSGHVADGSYVWLVLLTPARLADSFRPPLDTVGGVRATVRAALVGPPTIVGGFSLVAGRLRNNKTCVPAGSAWLVELSGGRGEDRAATLRQWNGRCLWGDEFERAAGFGHVLVSVPDPSHQDA